MVRIVDPRGGWPPPPTPEEREEALALLERIKQRRERLLAARGGKPFPGAAEVIRELRDEADADSDQEEASDGPDM